MADQTDLAALLAHLRHLEQRIAELEAGAVRHPAVGAGGEKPERAGPASSNRRDVLRMAGMGVIGAAGATFLNVGSAAAAPNPGLVLDQNNDATTDTMLSVPSSAANATATALTITAGATTGGHNGVNGLSVSAGDAQAASGGNGIAASGGSGSATSGAGGSGLRGRGGGAPASQAGDGLVASGGAGAVDGVGASLSGGGAAGVQLRLNPGQVAGPPPANLHQIGDVWMDKVGVAWVCTTGGLGGIERWTRLAGVVSSFSAQANTGGVVNLLPNPIRLLDTRQGSSGIYADGSTHSVQISGAPDLSSPASAAKVPVGAVAVIGNVTVTGGTAPGYLTLYPDATARPGTSTINYGAGATVANACTVGLSPAGKLGIFTFGTTHVIFDAVAFVL